MVPSALQTSPPFPFAPNLLVYANQLRRQSEIGSRAAHAFLARNSDLAGSVTATIRAESEIPDLAGATGPTFWTVVSGAGDAAVAARRQRHLHPGRSRPTSLVLIHKR